MTPTEILDKRIATATRRYTAALEDAALEDAALRIKHEQTRISEGKLEEFCGTTNLSILSHLLTLNAKLNELLALKDQIENQAREEIA